MSRYWRMGLGLMAIVLSGAAVRGQDLLGWEGLVDNPEVGAFAARDARKRPNILLLVLDDQDAFTPFWDAMPRTRRMVRDKGMTFTTAFAPTPICAPGRCTLLSGRLAHNTGVFTLVGPYGGNNFSHQLNHTLPVELMRRGYTNAMFGKSWGTTQINPGWHVWCALGGDHMYEGYGYTVTEDSLHGPPRGYIGNKYSTDFLSDKVVEFLRDREGDRSPFFIWLGPTAPHLPLPPAPRHARIAQARWGGKLPKRPNFNEAEISDKSAWLRATGAVRSAAVPYAQGEYPKRMGSLMAVDEMMERIRRELLAQDEWDNTVVIVVSDNGYNLGSHRLIHKQAPYEESERVPLAIAGPGIAKGKVSKLVGIQDIAPTIVELAGGRVPGWMEDGRSLVPFLDGEDEANVRWRDAIVGEYIGGYVTPGYNPGGSMRRGYSLDLPTYTSLRTERYKYIRWQSGEEEIYDLRADPYELSNMLKVRKPGVTKLRQSLRAKLARELQGG
jgi:N-acetylglucosamine-6-sulfatase